MLVERFEIPRYTHPCRLHVTFGDAATTPVPVAKAFLCLASLSSVGRKDHRVPHDRNRRHMARDESERARRKPESPQIESRSRYLHPPKPWLI
jgi:hypothetical protein